MNRQILKVEDELGIKPFERSHNGIRLTPAGQLLAAHVGRTLADAARAVAEISALNNSTRPVVTIAGQESVIARFLPPALVELHAARPDVSTRAAPGSLRPWPGGVMPNRHHPSDNLSYHLPPRGR